MAACALQTKRAITLEEHQKIIAAEKNPERKAHYKLCWHLGASQGDIASLKGEDLDWQNSTVSFTRKKTGVPVIVHWGAEALNVFKDLPAEGILFPYLNITVGLYPIGMAPDIAYGDSTNWLENPNCQNKKKDTPWLYLLHRIFRMRFGLAAAHSDYC